MSKQDDEGPTPEEGLAAALRLLRARGRSRAEVQDALLHRGFDARTCEEVLSRLTQLGYLDDPKLAAARARSLIQTGYGLAGIEYRLKNKGVEGALAAKAAREAMAETGIEEREQARGLIERRWKGKWPKLPKERAKAARLLASRGYAQEIIEQLFGDGTLDLEDGQD
jgi:regulatory protein